MKNLNKFWEFRLENRTYNKLASEMGVNSRTVHRWAKANASGAGILALFQWDVNNLPVELFEELYGLKIQNPTLGESDV